MSSGLYSSELVFVAVDRLRKICDYLSQVGDVSLKNVAYTCTCETVERLSKAGQGERPEMVAFVASSVSDLRIRMQTALSRISSGSTKIRDKNGTYYFKERLLGPGTGGKLAWIFPGGASFYPDMLRDVAIRFPECRAAFDELSEALDETLHKGQFSPNAFIFPPASYYRKDADVFASGAYAEAMVAVYSANYAFVRFLKSLGLKPDALVGYAGGNLNAISLSGALGNFARPERQSFLKDIYQTIDNVVNHAGLKHCRMVSCLAMNPDSIDRVFSSYSEADISLTLSQTPRQKTFALSPEKADEIIRAFNMAGVRTMKLAVDRPFNTTWAKAIEPSFAKLAERWIRRKTEIPLYSCVSGSIVPEKVKAIREDATMQLSSPALLDETVRSMFADGVSVFLEVGPRSITAGSANEILRGEKAAVLATNSIHRSGVLQLQHAVAMLAALGAEVNPMPFFENRKARKLNFDDPLAVEIRNDAVLHLSREFPRMRLFDEDGTGYSFVGQAAGAKTERRAEKANRERKQRQFEFGAFAPLISDADRVDEQPGVMVEVHKTLDVRKMPMISDTAIGVYCVSYSDPAKRGLVALKLPIAIEMMAELAQTLVPNRNVVSMAGLECRHQILFAKGIVNLKLRAERVTSSEPSLAAVKVRLSEITEDGDWTNPSIEMTVYLSLSEPKHEPSVIEPLRRPRSVHWMQHDIYPDRVCAGGMMRNIVNANFWSEGGIDYSVAVPSSAKALDFTRFPVWIVNPLMMTSILDGFPLWRSYQRFAGSLAFAFRIGKITLHTHSFNEGSVLKCYLRLTGVTPNSHIADIIVSDGNGQKLCSIGGVEEYVERFSDAYPTLVLSPSKAFLTEEISDELIGAAGRKVSTAMITEVPYKLFEQHESFWLNVVSSLVLGRAEQNRLSEMTGSVSRKTEWLFGRIAAKEAMRRFLSANYQARWSDADVQICPDMNGKPVPSGDWEVYLTSKVDLAIAHTSQFVVAIVAANMRSGIDVEAVDRNLSEEFTKGVFTPEELELAALSSNSPSAMVRFWCSKEAVSKALGVGIRYPPHDMVVRSFKTETGDIEVELLGAWMENFKSLKGIRIKVTTRVVRGHVLATCFISETYFK